MSPDRRHAPGRFALRPPALASDAPGAADGRAGGRATASREGGPGVADEPAPRGHAARAGGVVFDLDGTLIDSVPDIHAAVGRTLEGLGQPPLPLPVVRGFVGNGVPALIERVMAARGLAPDPVARARLVEAFMGHYMAAPTALTRPYPGVVEALAALAGEGRALGLCTNKPEAATRAILDGLGLASAFAAVVGGDSLPVRKPDPAPLRLAAERLGRPGVLYVGDSEVDAETARRAGLPFLLFLGGYRRAPPEAMPHDAAFDDFRALPGLVRRLLRAAGA